jgi:hypothetical protein
MKSFKNNRFFEYDSISNTLIKIVIPPKHEDQEIKVELPKHNRQKSAY